MLIANKVWLIFSQDFKVFHLACQSFSPNATNRGGRSGRKRPICEGKWTFVPVQIRQRSLIVNKPQHGTPVLGRQVLHRFQTG